MGVLDSVKRLLAIEPMQERTVDPFAPAPDLSAQIAALRVNQAAARPWRTSSLADALGVPSVFRAVSLIANTTGALAVEAYRNGALMPAEDRPRLIIRPNPFTTPRDFYRDTAYSMATRGEAWWWVAARDTDGSALSLLTVNPAEVSVSLNERDLRYPIIEWRGRKMLNSDMVQITLIKEPGALRGMGPLQMCGAAVSVAVEAQEWAANFFASGGYPSVILQSEVELTELEAAALKSQWTATPANMPKVTNPGLTFAEFGANPQGAQMMQARDYQNGDVARMYGIPASLLDHTTPGSTLTYQNLEGEFTKFVRGALWINYLEPIEQAMTDLLTRSTTMKFDVDTLQRADVKTRYEVYASGITSGVLTVEEARAKEGLEPGNMENAPVPFAPSAAFPSVLPIQGRSADGWRCSSCARKIAEAQGYGTQIRCRCGTLNEGLEPLAVREAPAPVINVTSPVSVVFEPGSIVTPVDARATIDARTVIEDGALRVESPISITNAAPEPEPETATVTRLEYDEEGRIIGIAEAS